MNKICLSLPLFFSSFTMANEPVERVISLAPHATEIAYAAGLGDKLIAVSEMSDYPKEAGELEKVSNYQGIKLERIIALQPDLVIAWPAGNPAKELEKLKQFGVPIYYSTTGTLEDIANNIEQLSQYSDDPSKGQKAARDFREGLTALKAKYNTTEKVRYFYQLSEKPIITVAGKNWPSEVFNFCGGENVFANTAAPYPQVSIEQVITRQPEVLFTSRHAMSDDGMWAQWKNELPALRNNHVWSLNSDWINRPTPRTLNAIIEVCEHFESVRRKR
ncbi:vitamin B12 ABC transporter substrate-binding protein BtuF [Vibrio parahaemolyticus]|uniref:vitamin B12 ABC transporter substrate-binding protein BtuF n=1 Tax=Vibrio parahaemolyticus TaxID=670 RepID=UPI0015595372|nr:vitamin B12 ABC transporter substrate-binding protein BtuF [Vibrio parahaemolyticus]MCR9645132.1 vitamin B12 ABC transporter substrate-binding protein BtuF [Vibrio parahaemolyticus]MCR9798991.1 vitamin B12 ABC transporter substrate-binding protein BtuF [Vibrio parahaemolyticus]MDF4284273.1 vitamin B12 ABC transporter substrate-binding protein BtuF [Vibrio parahaemolyticus]MDF4315566.1 vitamin B12 ABC transporter substrate-binding protein BtuF [Vibrio parahaemolyticus]MDF4965890.1 vitamin B1